MTYQLSREGQLEENEFWTGGKDAEFRQKAAKQLFRRPVNLGGSLV
jgi:hypothetical protein